MLTKDIENNFPFLSVINYGGKEYIGVVINQDASVTSMYIYTALHTKAEQEHFLEVGEVWWWESNRMIPINIFLGIFRVSIQIFLIPMNSKDVKVSIGPCVNLNNLAVKRIKRKSVQLVRRPPKG